MSARDGDGPALADLLADLEETLRALRAELDPAGSRRPGPPLRPPTPRELLRFTESYTIPTLVAVLEANVRALELLRATLRLVDPERSVEGADELRGLGDVGDLGERAREDVADRLAGSLADLREALSAADLPEDPQARSVLTEARELTAEVESRLGEAGADVDGGTAGSDGPVDIDIDIESDEEGNRVSDADGDGGDRGGDSDRGVDVDVESELRSIKDEVEGDESTADTGTTAADSEPAEGDDPDADSDPRD